MAASMTVTSSNSSASAFAATKWTKSTPMNACTGSISVELSAVAFPTSTPDPRAIPLPPVDFATTIRAEHNNHWYALHTIAPPSKDTWFWERLQPQGANGGITRTLAYEVPYPSGNGSGLLRLEENARAAVDHRTKISLNGVLLLDERWTGKTRRVFNSFVPANLITHGNNNVDVGAFNVTPTQRFVPLAAEPAAWDELGATALQPDAIADDVYVNYWELEYRRLFRAWKDQLDFQAETAGANEYEVDGWTTSAIAVWDITRPDQPYRLTAASATPMQGDFRIRFRTNDQIGNRYWLQTEKTIAQPTSIRLRPPTGLRAPSVGADVVIVVSSQLRPAARQLATWHRAQGRRVVIADFLDIVDEFNDGIYNPKAVPAMLAWAQEHWPAPAPRYLTLVGDGHWDFKGYNLNLYPPLPNHIPPFLVFADPWQGEVPSDNRYGDLNNDGRPDIAVGRLAVNTLAEAETVVAKIVNYDDTVRLQPWQKSALFVADNADDVGDYPSLTDSIIENHLPADLTPQRIYSGCDHSRRRLYSNSHPRRHQCWRVDGTICRTWEYLFAGGARNKSFACRRLTNFRTAAVYPS